MLHYVKMLIIGILCTAANVWAKEPTKIIIHPLCAPTNSWNQTGALNANVDLGMGYPCGCDPLAWGQIIVYHALAHQTPNAQWQPKPQTFEVDLYQPNGHLLRREKRTTSAQSYDWKSLCEQGKDVSRFMYDLGTLARTAYRPGLASGTFHRSLAESYFGYKSRGWCYTYPISYKNGVMETQPGWSEMILQQVRASLHARAPMIVSLINDQGGHAVICDGYGYAEDGTLLFHLHYGWGKTSGYWQPASWWSQQGGKDRFQTVTINVHPRPLGCVLAGRITKDGNALANTLVELSNGDKYTTDDTGSYCFTGLTENTPYTLTVYPPQQAAFTTSLKTGKFVDDEERQKAQDAWENTHGKDDAYRVPLAGGNVIIDVSLP